MVSHCNGGARQGLPTLHTSHSSDAATASCYNNMIQGEPKNNMVWKIADNEAEKTHSINELH